MQIIQDLLCATLILMVRELHSIEIHCDTQTPHIVISFMACRASEAKRVPPPPAKGATTDLSSNVNAEILTIFKELADHYFSAGEDSEWLISDLPLLMI
jgi:hypothetical protein